MKRIRLTLQYDGTGYSGWQVQENAVGIQNEIERALFEITGEDIRVTGAGRTDKGVHALGQVAHFDTDRPIPGDKWRYHLNPKLPDAIRVIASEEAAPDFHARFSAVSKRYRYTVYTGAIRPPMFRNYTAHVTGLDLSIIRETAPLFLGKHDYRAFMSSGSPVPHTIRTVDAVQIVKKDEFLHFEYEAESFLYNQIRIMTGTLVEVGLHKMQPAQIRQALSTGIRALAGPTMPAEGLTLVEVCYSQEETI